MSAMNAFPITSRPAGGALIASPSGAVRERVLEGLKGRWWPVQHALGGAEALEKLGAGEWQILYLDRRLPDLDSEELIAIVKRRFPGIQVVLLDPVAVGSTDDGRKAGAMPDATSSLASGADSALGTGQADSCRREKEEDGEKDRDDGYPPLPGMIGRSPGMQALYRMAQLVAPHTTSVLIVGPTGSGKELVARALHALSPRAGKPFVAVNCAAIPDALLESELFGYARGAFTGAVQAQVGRIPAAHGGTLFLDEVSELPLATQAKLLRFLEQKEVQRLGTADVVRVDVRVVAASNVDLAARAGKGEFREDLFYRLAAFPLELPPLNERVVDIVPLAEHFLECMAAAMNMACPRLSPEAVHILENHPWRGNVRELQHVMERASILVQNADTILPEHLYFPFQQSIAPSPARYLTCTGRAS
jgi:DNA-binding NtrC family response regulator